MRYDACGETATATFQVTAKDPGRTGVVVMLLDGEEPLKTLHLPFDILPA